MRVGPAITHGATFKANTDYTFKTIATCLWYFSVYICHHHHKNKIMTHFAEAYLSDKASGWGVGVLIQYKDAILPV